MRNVLYTRSGGASVDAASPVSIRLCVLVDSLTTSPFVLHAVAGDRLEEPRWRRAQSTPKVLASTVYPATLLEI